MSKIQSASNGLLSFSSYLAAYTAAADRGASERELKQMELAYYKRRNAALRAEREAEKERKYQESERAKASERAELAEPEAKLLSMSSRLTAIWTANDKGMPHKRKPPIGLRLPTLGAVGRLVITPGFDRKERLLLPETHRIELLVDQEKTGVSLRSLVVHLHHARIEYRSHYVGRRVGDMKIVTETLGLFLNEPAKYVGILKPVWCLFCGRPLSDAISLGRGIGPECIQSLPFFRDVFRGECDH